ncbi:conserved protein of unknown function [Bradyrhizobium sp. ORS 285]|nr:conserved protein of unknown function [Bradyrhizobium sp. ORS 285]
MIRRGSEATTRAAISVSPSPGGGGSIAREAGDRVGVSRGTQCKWRDHPTPDHIALRSM